MKKLIFFSIILLSAIGFTSCTNEDIKTYETTNNVYFSPAVYANVFPDGIIKNGILADSTGLSFAYDPISLTKTTYKIPIRVQGQASTVDRSVKVSVDALSTAIQGTHFELPTQVVIGAGKVVDTIAVTVFRTPEMKTQTFTLVLNLEENEFFETKMQDKVIDILTGKKLSFIRFKLSFDDKLVAPRGWHAATLGVFSVKKFYLMTSLIGLDPAIFKNSPGGPGLSPGEMSYYKSFMKRYLADQKAAGNTIYEDDGTEMQFPA